MQKDFVIFRAFVLLLVVLLSLSGSKLVQADERFDGLTIAVNKTSYPYHFVTPGGEIDGMMVDIWKLWAQKQGISVDFKLMGWQETLDAVRTGSADLHAGMHQTPERERSPQAGNRIRRRFCSNWLRTSQATALST